MGGTCITCGERRGIYMVLLGKSELKRPLGRPKYKWKDNVKSVGMARTGSLLAQEQLVAVVDTVMNVRVP
jgi:hypothetical protein